MRALACFRDARFAGSIVCDSVCVSRGRDPLGQPLEPRLARGFSYEHCMEMS
jgi:hypothetical protein